MATLPKWTDERTEELTNFIGDESPVSQDTVAVTKLKVKKIKMGTEIYEKSSIRGSIGWSKGKHSWTLQFGDMHPSWATHWIVFVCFLAWFY